jgi:S1-C subfamily serine protease
MTATDISAEALDEAEKDLIRSLTSADLCDHLQFGSLPAEGLLQEIEVRAIDCQALAELRPWEYKPEPKMQTEADISKTTHLEPSPDRTTAGIQEAELGQRSVDQVSKPVPTAREGGSSGESDAVLAATVRVSTLHSAGSGFYIDANHIATNAHVVESAEWVLLATNNSDRPFPGWVTYRNRNIDFAVISTDTSGQPASLHQGAIQFGAEVMTLGYPQGRTRLAASTGSISEITTCCIIHDALIAAGSSGGPLVDQNREVLGLNTLISKMPGDRANESDRGVTLRMDYVAQMVAASLPNEKGSLNGVIASP